MLPKLGGVVMKESIEGMELVKSYLEKLTVKIGERHVGSLGNAQAVEYFYNVLSSLDYDVQMDEFDCIDWECGEVNLIAGNEQYKAFVSPYSLPCDVKEELVVVSTLGELKTADVSGKILLITDELTKEQIMPKNFTFYNPDEHKEIVSILEEKEPMGIICVTKNEHGISGGLYPFPIFEDGDFDIPSVYMKDVEAEKLIKYNGEKVTLSFCSRRIPAKGSNVSAYKKGKKKGRLVLCAHIDTKKNTPGALDNASGVTVLMMLAKELNDYKGDYDVEIVAFNGEDYYSVPGQMLYMNQNYEELHDIKMVINIDGAGHKDSKTAVSFYNIEDNQIKNLMKNIEVYKTIIKGEEWYEGDHSMFLQQGVPCIAVTSSNVREVGMNITHTPKDVIDNVDPALLWEISSALKNIINNFS